MLSSSDHRAVEKVIAEIQRDAIKTLAMKHRIRHHVFGHACVFYDDLKAVLASIEPREEVKP
jgi:hypothetical protein